MPRPDLGQNSILSGRISRLFGHSLRRKIDLGALIEEGIICTGASRLDEQILGQHVGQLPS